MDKIDHIAIQTNSIKDSVVWYQKMFKCEIEFEDDSWALLKFQNTKLALVVPDEGVHPFEHKSSMTLTNSERSCLEQDRMQ